MEASGDNVTLASIESSGWSFVSRVTNPPREVEGVTVVLDRNPVSVR